MVTILLRSYQLLFSLLLILFKSNKIEYNYLVVLPIVKVELTLMCIDSYSIAINVFN